MALYKSCIIIIIIIIKPTAWLPVFQCKSFIVSYRISYRISPYRGLSVRWGSLTPRKMGDLGVELPAKTCNLRKK